MTPLAPPGGKLRIAQVAPLANSLPPPRSGSVETITWLLTEQLVARGHDVTLFATGDSATTAKLHSVAPHGYHTDRTMWPWEMYDLLNLAAAVERASEFDVIHFQAEYYPMSLPFTRLSSTLLLQTLHYAPHVSETALWSQYPEAPFVAISQEQARLLAGLNVVGTVLHGLDVSGFPYRETPEDYLLFIGRFTGGKGSRQAIEVAKKLGVRLVIAGEANDYYREHLAPLVDGTQIVYFGEADRGAKEKLYGGARALIYPIQRPEPFGLVLVEAMACGTPVAALNRGAVREVVDDGVTGVVFDTIDEMATGLSGVFELDRRRVRERAIARFSAERMAIEYEAVYRRVLESRFARR
jgi:glycosyltransferase involved in cell wall biosynthesis